MPNHNWKCIICNFFTVLGVRIRLHACSMGAISCPAFGKTFDMGDLDGI